jgi:hypothetical protein
VYVIFFFQSRQIFLLRVSFLGLLLWGTETVPRCFNLRQPCNFFDPYFAKNWCSDSRCISVSSRNQWNAFFFFYSSSSCFSLHFISFPPIFLFWSGGVVTQGGQKRSLQHTTPFSFHYLFLLAADSASWMLIYFFLPKLFPTLAWFLGVFNAPVYYLFHILASYSCVVFAQLELTCPFLPAAIPKNFSSFFSSSSRAHVPNPQDRWMVSKLSSHSRTNILPPIGISDLVFPISTFSNASYLSFRFEDYFILCFSFKIQTFMILTSPRFSPLPVPSPFQPSTFLNPHSTPLFLKRWCFFFMNRNRPSFLFLFPDPPPSPAPTSLL